MGSLQLQDETLLVQKVCEIYHKLSKLESLKPSPDANSLFTELVHTCIPPSAVNLAHLSSHILDIRANLIKLCGQAEGLLEAHFSTLLGAYPTPLDHLDLFPYHTNYLKLSRLEHDLLRQHRPQAPARLAFVGSGPLPLTSIVLASRHLQDTMFYNYDVDAEANAMAARLVAPDPDLSRRMVFRTADIMDVTEGLAEFDVVFLAALVGMDMEFKIKVIRHLAKHMAPGATLMLRSAHGARAFLYPVVDAEDLQGFEVLATFHPHDDVINSIVVAQKLNVEPPSTTAEDHAQHHHQLGMESSPPSSILPSSCKYCEFQAFNKPLNQMNIIEDLAFDE